MAKPSRSPNLEELFLAFRARGDRAALAELFERTAPSLLGLALQICGDAGEAEDLVQATFLSAIENPTRYDSRRRLLPWLMGILVNHARRAKRDGTRSIRDPWRFLERSVSDPHESAEIGEFSAVLAESMDRLPAIYRRVLELHFHSGLRSHEIAAELDRPQATVRSQMHRALRRLRNLIGAGFAALFAHVLPARSPVAATGATGTTATASALRTGLGGPILVKKSLVMGLGLLILFGLGTLYYWIDWPTDDGGPFATQRVELRGEEQRQRQAATPTDGETPHRAVLADGTADATLGVRLIVEVRDANTGKGVEGVGIRIAPDRGHDPFLDTRLGVTDSEGRRVFAGVPWGLVAVQTDRGVTKTLRLVDVAEETVRLTLPSGFGLRGRVVDADGKPVTGAAIWLSQSTRSSLPGQVVAESVDDGRFVLRGVKGRQWVSARAKGHAPAKLVRLPDRPAGDGFAVEIKLGGPGCELSGRVVDGRGEAIAAAKVRILEGTTTVPLIGTPPWVLCCTDGEGRYRAEGLRPGRASVLVRAVGYGPDTEYVELQHGVPGRHDVTLRSGASLSGRVTDASGRPIEGARVEVRGLSYFATATAVSAADGSYHLEGISADRVFARAKARANGEVRTVLHPKPLQHLLWNPVLQPAPYLEGRLVDEDGEALAGWSVVLAETARNEKHQATTDADGRFHISRLAARGYRLFARDRNASMGSGYAPSASPRVLRPGPHEVEVRMRTDRPAGTMIAGRLLDHAGAAVGRAPILVIQEEFLAIHVDPTDAATGAFRIGPLPPGNYSVILNYRSKDGPDFRVDDLQLTDGADRDLGDLRLAAPGTLRLRLSRPDGKKPELLAIWFGSRMLAQGRVEGRWSVASGKHRLKIYGGDVVPVEREVEIRPGEERSLEIELVPGIRRQLVFPVPRLPRWVDDSPFRAVVTGVSNDIRISKSFDPSGASWPTAWFPLLGAGRYEIEVHSDRGGVFHGRFELSDISWSLRPIRIRLF